MDFENLEERMRQQGFKLKKTEKGYNILNENNNVVERFVSNSGIYISDLGRAVDENFNEIKPAVDVNDYLFIKDEYLSLAKPSGLIAEKDGNVYNGKYLHRMVAFSFGDYKGRPYSGIGFRSVVDHLDMNHSKNAVFNLQMVSEGINLFRAYYKTKNPKNTTAEQKFKNYYNSLSGVDLEIFLEEMRLDLGGNY